MERHKKNVKRLYIVHPSLWFKIVLFFMQKIVSSKFAAKIINVETLEDLGRLLPIDPIAIPSAINQFDRDRREGKSHNSNNQELSAPAVRLFGVSLGDAAPDGSIPVRIEQLMEYIEANLLDLDGIFRRSPDTPILNQLRKAIDRGVDLDYSDYDSGTVACLLKAYVREFPEPLIPPSLYPILGDLFNYQSVEAQGKFIRKTILNPMPMQSVFFLGRLMALLAAVASHSGRNNMSARNLAIVWSPNLIRHERAEDEMKTLKVSHQLIEFMITNHEHLF